MHPLQGDHSQIGAQTAGPLGQPTLMLVKDGNQFVRCHEVARPKFNRCKIKGSIARDRPDGYPGAMRLVIKAEAKRLRSSCRILHPAPAARTKIADEEAEHALWTYGGRIRYRTDDASQEDRRDGRSGRRAVDPRHGSPGLTR